MTDAEEKLTGVRGDVVEAQGDDEDPGEVLLARCVFLDGRVLIGDGDGTFDSPETLKRWYGKDRRIWSAKPTEEERSAEKWVV